MAKKVVATLKKEGGVQWAKVIRSVKNENGSYSFKEEMMPADQVQAFLSKSKQ